MSPREIQGDDGCVTVEYTTEGKQELYDLDDELATGERGTGKPSGDGVMAWVFRGLIQE